MVKGRKRKRSFGISLEPSWPINYCLDLAALSEKLGFSCVWIPDGGPAPPYSDAMVTISAIASRTSKIKFGSAIFNFYTRNPALLASSFLALSDLGSRGKKAGEQRAILGLGVGSPYNVAKFGITKRKGVIDEMREGIEAIRELHKGKEVIVRTDSFVIDGVTLSKSKNKIPIYVGSNSPKGLTLAGEIADGVILTDRIPSDIDESLKHIDLGIGYGIRNRRDLEILDSVVISMDENRERARAAAKVTCAYLVAWLGDDKAKTQGIDLVTKNKISAFIEKGQEASAAKLVDEKILDLLTASGNLEDCVQKCREYLSHDIDQIAFCEPFGPSPKKSIETIAKKLIPKL